MNPGMGGRGGGEGGKDLEFGFPSLPAGPSVKRLPGVQLSPWQIPKRELGAASSACRRVCLLQQGAGPLEGSGLACRKNRVGEAVSPKAGKEGTSAQRMGESLCLEGGGQEDAAVRDLGAHTEVGVLRCAWRLLLHDGGPGGGQDPPFPSTARGKEKARRNPEKGPGRQVPAGC